MTDLGSLATSLGSEGAALSAEAFRAAGAALAQLTQGTPRRLWVPGRVEVLGKHTDYAGGATMTCALARGICVAWMPRADARLRVVDATDQRALDVTIEPALVVPRGKWSTYPITVARRLARNFGPGLAGADVAFWSTLPRSAGLSSSSALVTALFLVLSETNRLAEREDYRVQLPDLPTLAAYLGSVENGQPFGAFAGDRGVGTFGGSEDHTAIVCSEPGRIGHFEFSPTRRLASLPVPAGHVFAIGASGVLASKTGNARERYNRASLLASEVLRQWREATGRQDGTLGIAVRSAPDAAGRLRALLRDGGNYDAADLRRRLDHFLLENERLVPAAADTLARGDVASFGALVDESQRGAEGLLGNQVPETVALARLAREQGAAAASAFGAGFGGSVWALLPSADADRFVAAWQAAYARAARPSVFNKAEFFLTPAAPPATRLTT